MRQREGESGSAGAMQARLARVLGGGGKGICLPEENEDKEERDDLLEGGAGHCFTWRQQSLSYSVYRDGD